MPIKKIDIRKLQVGMSLAKPAFRKQSGKRILLLPSNTLISNELQIRRLIDAGITSVEIDTNRGSDTFLSIIHQKKWEELIQEKKDQKTMDMLLSRHINTFVNSLTNTILKTHMSRIRINEGPVASIIKDIIVFIESNIDVLMSTIRLKSINEYTFRHSVNTTVLCISLAHSMGFKYSDIVRFGTGTLLADIGMTSFPSRMIKRPSGLSKKEIEEIKKHPIFAVEFLEQIGVKDPLIETVILQHHERYDGSGYPIGLGKDDIHPISKLFSLVDVYVAMTSPRPHRAGIPPHLVLREIHNLSGTLFDPKMKDIFIKYVGVFPPGNMVELTGGQVALVVNQNKEEPLKPLVIVFQKRKKINRGKISRFDDDEFIISRGSWDLVDLAKDNGVYGKIKCGLDHRKLHINPNTYLLQV